MELYEVMRTTFAAREFTDQPVSDEVIAHILEQARFAPSGGNRQGWKVLVVRQEQMHMHKRHPWPRCPSWSKPMDRTGALRHTRTYSKIGTSSS